MTLPPVAVPDKIFGLTLILDFIDRGHSLRSLHPPLAALPSLPGYGIFIENMLESAQSVVKEQQKEAS